MVLIGDTKQPMSEGKSGPAKTGLTRPVATTPIYKYTFQILRQDIYTIITISLLYNGAYSE